eukprot:COSAG04_NODE_938_length_9314_cov_3.854287_6_plen_58_part_00
MIVIALQEKDKLEDIFGADSSDEEDAKGEEAAAAAPVRPHPVRWPPAPHALLQSSPR